MGIVDKEEGWFGREDEVGNRGRKLLAIIMVAVAALGLFIHSKFIYGKTLHIG